VTPLQTSLALIPVAYLIGTFPSASIVARFKGIDITKEGSGNPGASNVTRTLGWKLGAVVLVADMLKGVIAAEIGLQIDGHRGAYILGSAAVLGHVFPVFRRFKGGRGVATAAGVVAVVFPLLTASLAVVWVAVAKLSGKASLASIVVAIAFPICVAIAHPNLGDILISTGLAVIVLARHVGNVRRLVRGQEHDLRGGPGTGSISAP
jgi:glycerol-3-phosphate acyltransferase PlsY